MNSPDKRLTLDDFNSKQKTSKLSKEEMDKLCDYYRLRISNFEKERYEWLTALEGIKTENEEFHKKEWELRKLCDRIIEMQSSLSEANISLNQERKNVIRYNNEIDSYKLDAKEDRRRMIQLLQFAEPIEANLKTFYDKRPQVTGTKIDTNYNFDEKQLAAIKNSVSLIKCVDKNAKVQKDKKEYRRKTPSDARKNVIKTIMFPSDTNENLATDENKLLKKQKEEIKVLYENIIIKMQEDEKLREEEFRLQGQNMATKTTELKKRKAKLEQLNFDLTKDYMDLKYDIEINSKKINDEVEETKLQNQALESTLKDMIKKTEIEREVARNEYARKTREVTNSLRNQIKAKEARANLVKEQYKQVQKIYADKVKALENKLKEIEGKWREMEGRKGISSKEYEERITGVRNLMRGHEEFVYDMKRAISSLTREKFFSIYDSIMEETSKFLAEAKLTDEQLIVLREKFVEELRDYMRMVNSRDKRNEREEKQGQYDDLLENESKYSDERMDAQPDQ